MSGTVARYAGGSAAVGAPVAQGGTASTAHADWRPAVTWDDLPPDAQAAAPERGALGSVVVFPRGARRRDGRVVQVRLAARAYPNRVIVVQVARPVRGRPDGRLEPDGDWAVVEITEHRAVAPPAVRRGVVDAGPLLSGEHAIESGPAPHRDHEAAIDAEAYLPREVVAGLVLHVPHPDVHLGALLLLGGRQEATVIRIHDARAVVVVAQRSDSPAAPWQVAQRTYELAPTRGRIGR